MYWSAALHSHHSHCSQLSHCSALWSIGGWAPHGPGQTGFQGGLAGPLKGDVLVSRSALSFSLLSLLSAVSRLHCSLIRPGLIRMGSPWSASFSGWSLEFLFPADLNSLLLSLFTLAPLELGAPWARGLWSLPLQGPGGCRFPPTLTHSGFQFTAALNSPLSQSSPWPLWN